VADMAVSIANAAGASAFLNTRQSAPDLIYRSISLDAAVAFELRGQSQRPTNYPSGFDPP